MEHEHNFGKKEGGALIRGKALIFSCYSILAKPGSRTSVKLNSFVNDGWKDGPKGQTDGRTNGRKRTRIEMRIA